MNVLLEFLGNLDILDYEPVITNRQKAEKINNMFGPALGWGIAFV